MAPCDCAIRRSKGGEPGSACRGHRRRPKPRGLANINGQFLRVAGAAPTRKVPTMNRLLAALAVLAFFAGPLKAQAPQTVVIGLAGPLTGGSANAGKDNENGALLAIADLNRQGLTIGGQRLHFELDSQDDQGDPKQATAGGTAVLRRQRRGRGRPLQLGRDDSGLALLSRLRHAADERLVVEPGRDPAGFRDDLPHHLERRGAGRRARAPRGRRAARAAHCGHRRPHGIRTGGRRPVREGGARAWGVIAVAPVHLGDDDRLFARCSPPSRPSMPIWSSMAASTPRAVRCCGRCASSGSVRR